MSRINTYMATNRTLSQPIKHCKPLSLHLFNHRMILHQHQHRLAEVKITPARLFLVLLHLHFQCLMQILVVLQLLRKVVQACIGNTTALIARNSVRSTKVIQNLVTLLDRQMDRLILQRYVSDRWEISVCFFF